MSRSIPVVFICILLGACTTAEQGAVDAAVGAAVGGLAAGRIEGPLAGAAIGGTSGYLVGRVKDRPGICRYRSADGLYEAPCNGPSDPQSGNGVQMAQVTHYDYFVTDVDIATEPMGAEVRVEGSAAVILTNTAVRIPVWCQPKCDGVNLSVSKAGFRTESVRVTKAHESIFLRLSPL
jgi:hypothetical protein